MNTKVKQEEKAKDSISEDKTTGQLPAERTTGSELEIVDFGEDAGRGIEDIDSSEVRIPFIFILASNSPQTKPAGQPGAVAGAQQGMIMNGGSGELYDVSSDWKKGLKFIPCYRDHNFVEFVPKNLGGGFVAVYPPDDPTVLMLQAQHGKFGKLPRNCTGRNPDGTPKDGTEITETFYLYGLLVSEDGATEQVIVPFKSTQIKKYQSFIQRTKSFKYKNPRSTPDDPKPPVVPPIWAHALRLFTQPEQNRKGEYWGWNVGLWARDANGIELPYKESLIKTSDPLYAEASAFNKTLETGSARADYKSDQSGADDTKDEPM